MNKVINWPLISHPMNWAIVILMVLIAGAGLHFLGQYYATMQADTAA